MAHATLVGRQITVETSRELLQIAAGQQQTHHS